MKIKKGDKVIVIAGRDKGKVGVVQRVLPKTNRVIVEGVNIRKKHLRPSPQNEAGGIIDFEAPIHVSNVAYLDPEKNVPTRVGYKFIDGKKVRYAKKSNKIIDPVE